jgi:hypothetical protein
MPTKKQRSGAKRKENVNRKTRPLTPRQQEEREKCFAAINRVRRGEAKTVSEAARVEGTTLRAIRALVPKAITQDRPGARIRVKPSDQYSQKVEILTHAGALVVTARGSRQRQLAGQHRATYLDVVNRKKPASALEQFRGRKVGGHELLSDYARLVTLANAGVLGQLDRLYVSAGGGR